MSASTDNAALVIIGDEILSGRTRDENVAKVAKWLNEQGVQLAHVRIIPDDAETIVDTVQDLRKEYGYVITTGGIGPTHDDITAANIARAMGRDLVEHPVARKMLEKSYGTKDLAPARLKMALIPEGAELIKNPVSGAPGFQVENVFVLAGIPKLVDGMLEDLRGRIRGENAVHSDTVAVFRGESDVADALSAVQDAHGDVAVGSYPFYRDGRGGTNIVVRSRDTGAIEKALHDLRKRLDGMGVKWQDGEAKV